MLDLPISLLPTVATLQPADLIPVVTGGVTSSIEYENLVPPVTGGGLSQSIQPISTNTNAASAANTNYFYLCSSGLTLTLPTAVSNTNIYTIKNIDGSTITIATTGGQTIDGSSTQTLVNQYASIDVVSNGSNWDII